MTCLIPQKHHDRLLTIGTYAQRLGLKAWVVGGAVRDFYLGRDTLDMDLIFDGNQESVAGFCVKQWGGEKRKFSKFATFKVTLKDGFKLDLARLRSEVYPYPGSLPQVSFTKDIKQDLFRRDFTANAWALSILPDTFGKSVDPYGARKDIDKGFLRVLHEKSFIDDPTRMYRGIRFAGRFGWRAAPKTKQLFLEAVKEEAPLLVSRERFCQEFLKILAEEKLKAVFDYLIEYDLLKFAWPSLKWTDALLQVNTVEERLGVLVCSLKENGEEFLSSLCVAHELSQAIMGAWKVEQQRLSPLVALTNFQYTVLRAVLPDLPQPALQPSVLRGQDLKDLGVYGRNISSLLDKVREAQWKGKISTREEALKFIGK
ncbi:MAG: CCA tRNA nucleotidyltransferase [Elusimicrobiaceae bacterium]|nr:CCA tRNA nucleotidyltransferase [Elusimicrobiaceae bacterium]